VLLSKFPVAYIDVRASAHATEDLDKVLSALRSVIPPELIDSVVFEKSSLTGHHGNPITLFETRIKEKEIAQLVFEKLSSGLSILDKQLLHDSLDQHLESGNLYLRLDKQSAYLKELKLAIADPIHLRIHFKKHHREEVMEICRKSGLLP